MSSESDYNLDPDAAAAAAGPGTRCILPVHLFGQMADMRRIAELARSVGVAIVEDACQAHGADRDGLRPGAAAAAAAFSFYPTKNLGAFGDAGALVTGDPALAGSVRSLRQHGERERERDVSERIGYTARLDTLQAAVLLRKLPLLTGGTRKRRDAAALYAAALAGVGDVRPLPVPAGSRPVWHLYPLRSAHADGLRAFLARRGIATGRHYAAGTATSLPPTRVWDIARARSRSPRASRAELVSLPIFPGISEHQLEWVAASVREYFDRGR